VPKGLRESSGLNIMVEVVERLINSEVKDLVDLRIKQFRENMNKPISEIFKELCFCMLTANFNAEKSIKIQSEIGDGFLTLPEDELADKLEMFGHRFPQSRAKYIVEARKIINQLRNVLHSHASSWAIRDWLVKNVKGLGYKEASHFLRNIGFMDLAIIDFHIINLLSRYGLIAKPKVLTKKKYIEIERMLKKIAEKVGLDLGVLDLYLWYMETGKILK
jgi:N-glycosylase/DNA lyase